MNHNTIHICELPVKTKAPERIAKRNYTPDDINKMCLDTFGQSFEHIRSRVGNKKHCLNDSKYYYYLKCLANHIFRTSHFATCESVGALLNVDKSYVSNANSFFKFNK